MKNHKAIKKVASFITAVTLSIASVPLSEFSGPLGSLLSNLQNSITAKAYDKYDVQDCTSLKKDGVYKIEYWNQLIWYSQAYYEYPDHENDTIVIDIGSNSVTTPLDGFEPIGTDGKPFAGKILFGNASADTFNLAAPLFGTVSETAIIAQQLNESQPRNITITRIQDNTSEPLIARKVLSDNDPDTAADWHVRFQSYSGGGQVDFGGFIGELGTGANVKLTAANDANTENKSAIVWTDSSDVGLFCQTMNGGATLDVDYSGAHTGFTIRSNSGNVGGLVGSMGDNSVLNLKLSDNPQANGLEISTGGDYAGGLVGSNNGGTIKFTLNGESAAYHVSQLIRGSSGTGGLFGYYKPPTDSNLTALSIGNISVDCIVTANTAETGYCGGLVGVMENDRNWAINGQDSNGDSVSVSTSHALFQDGDTDSQKAAGYGGLIGSYQATALANTLELTHVTSSIGNTLGASLCGGGVGEVKGASYIKFDDFTLSNAASASSSAIFGGIAAKAQDGYVFANDVTIGESDISSFTGGGMVGNLGNGVLGMSGDVDLSKAKPSASTANGQIVGICDNALVYADGWNFTTSDTRVDNIGSWGDVIVFGGNITKGNVFTEDGHEITIGTVSASSIASADDYAKVAILYSVDTTQNAVIKDASAVTGGVGFSGATIDLENTGLHGITRDKGTTHIDYTGSVSGNNAKIILDIQNVGGKPMYYHPYNAMLARVSNGSFENLQFGGVIKTASANADDNTMYVGTAAAFARGTFTANNVNTLDTLSITANGAKPVYAGRLLGAGSAEANNKIGNISVSDATFDGTISSSDSDTNTAIGGVIGKILHDANESRSWEFTDINLKGAVSGNQHIGGLIAVVNGYNTGEAAQQRKITLNGVCADGLTVTGSSCGLLGSDWRVVDVDVTDVSLANTPHINSGTGGAAGLVFRATGHWVITSLDMRNLKATCGGTFGAIVNRGVSHDDSKLYTEANRSAIYLELPSGYSYQLSFTTDTSLTGSVFDELCAYTSGGDIMRNGNGIVSISTSGLIMTDSAADSLSYHNKTSYGATANPNTRYYYNLDLVDAEGTVSDAPDKLMRWGAYTYASRNIKPYFTNPYSSTSVGAAGDNFIMRGYSWYPVNLDTPITINGNFSFYHKQFTDCEGEKSTANKWKPLDSNQHYMMQNGLFYNVTKNLTIGSVSFSGNIAATGESSGALICGTVSGTSGQTNGITSVDSSNGSISLAGIYVWNLDDHSTYAPLLINQASSYVDLIINDVSNTTAYKNGSSTISAATSLIGKAGTSSSSEYIKVTFSKIKLDGRENAGSDGIAESVYGTTKSIFTRATLLEQLQFSSGSGRYDYTYDEDWGSTGNRYVTYGKEIWDGSKDNKDKPDNHTSGYKQYIGQEHWYAGEPHNSTGRYTNPTTGTNATMYNFSGFIPYVKQYNEGNSQYQLQVNHEAANITGCGTYNDPYIISSAKYMKVVSTWLRGSFTNDDEICIPHDGLTATWCNTKATEDTESDHVTYKYVSASTKFFVDGDTSKDSMDPDKMQKYLAGAYYMISKDASDIELDGEADNGRQFQGLGTTEVPFHGVFIGNKKKIVNKTTYPLINCSTGSVVRDLTIEVCPENNIELAVGGNTLEVSNANYKAYGGIFAKVMGGDNIIDNVDVDYSKMTKKIHIKNKYSQLANIGGYVGCIYAGGVIFREMSGNSQNLADTLITYTGMENDNKASTVTDPLESNAWLYINPIVGRVINGFAVNEASAYAPYENGSRTFGDGSSESGNSVMLKNGTKHYSITDISKSEGKITINGNAVTIPDGQAFFIMSLIVNSGMAKSKLGYNQEYQVSRSADYDEVGTDKAATACDDYDDYAKNDKAVSSSTSNGTTTYTYKSSQSGYLAKTYASGNIANLAGNSSLTIILTGKTILPDGYKGLGNLFQNSNDYRVLVATFDGSGMEISQNTQYLYYNISCDNKYYPVKNDEYNGFGLFNCLTSPATFQNTILQGNVNCDVVDWKAVDGKSVDYTKDNTRQDYVMSVGSLVGTYRGSSQSNTTLGLTINSVALKNVDVHGVKYTGGMIGNVPKNKTVIKNDYELDSEKIKVVGGLIVGGLLGRNQEGVLELNFNDCTFSITEVVSKCTNQSDTGNQFNYGVGGIIGICRAGNNTATIKNVTICTAEQAEAASIKCENADIYTGGMFGVLNRTRFEIENCNINNVSVSSKSITGGMIGHIATSSGASTTVPSKIINSHMYTNKTAQAIIESTSTTVNRNMAGGYLGSGKHDCYDVFIQNSSIDGYTISGKGYTGGAIGNWGAKPSDTAGTKASEITLQNFKITNCTIKSDDTAGGIVGLLDEKGNKDKSLFGYNVLVNDVAFTAYTDEGTLTNKGYIIGKNNQSFVKLAGFSYQASKPSDKIEAAIGSDGTYGTNGYVIFADVSGVCVGNSKNESFSNIGIAGVGTTTNVVSADPFVTVNPKMTMDSASTAKFLTSDGVSTLSALDSGGYTTAAFAKIYADIIAKNPGYYEQAATFADTAAEYQAFTSKISSFALEMADKKPANGIDFPVLVVDNTDYTATTNLINRYIALLTNTSGYDFAKNQTGVYNTVIRRCNFDKDGKIITVSDTDVRLKTNNAGQFYMEADKTDTIATTAQFTLIDVQFLDPSDSSKIVYHLYVPVYVRKLLEYDFGIHLESGTSYDITNPYSAIKGNTLIENTGVPVTVEFAYTYKRNNDEWAAAINGGDSVLSNYTKSLVFSNTTFVDGSTRPNFDPATTKMVLIDTQNGSKAYYLDSLDVAGAFTGTADTKVLDLSKFTASDGTAFKPKNLNNMMTVTAAQADAGSLCKVSEHPNANVPATVKDANGIEYRPLTQTEKDNNSIPTTDRYTVSVSGADNLSEHYFLSIYTQYNDETTNKVVYHYAISAPETLGQTPYPSRLATTSKEEAAHLVTGYIYDNDVIINSLKVDGREDNYVITASNNEITAQMTANLELTQAGKDNVQNYLIQNNAPEIYQSLLVKFNKHAGTTSDIGVKAISSVSVSNYQIGNSEVSDPNDKITVNSNFIELQNGANLASNLYTSAISGNPVVIKATATFTFDSDKGDITKQFYSQIPTENRTRVIAYSNISSNPDQTAYSKVSTYYEDMLHEYYTEIEEKARFRYEAAEIAGQGQLPQLGINANDLDVNPVPISTLGAYDVTDFQSGASAANYIKCEFEVRTIDDGYANALTITDYLTDFEICDGITAASSDTSTAKKWTFVFSKSDLDYENGVYLIPISFSAYTGDTPKFESANRKYSNYSVNLTVCMTEKVDGDPIPGSDAPTDYVKFTNARIYTGKVDPNKLNP